MRTEIPDHDRREPRGLQRLFLAESAKPEPVWVPIPRKVERSAPEQPRVEEEEKGITLIPPITVTGTGELRAANGTFRLDGIEPLKPGRVCTDAAGRRWACALRARGELVTTIGARRVVCVPTEESGLPRPARCTIAGRSIAEQLVRDGWATPLPTAPEELIILAREAKEAGRGLWGAGTR